MYDVVIIGAGVIGGMLARELSRYKLSVCLLEKENDVACGASKANSGIIHGGYDPEPGTLKAKLNREGVPLLYAAADELSVPYRRNGSFVCAFGAEEEETLRKLYARGIENGIEQLSLISGDQARAMEPALSPDITLVLHVPTAGIICPYQLTVAAIGNAMDNGAELLRAFAVAAIDTDENGVTLTAADGRQVRGRFAVNCAGGFSDRIAALCGDGDFAILPRAGEYMLLDKTEGSRIDRTIFCVPTKEGKGILVSPTADGNLLVGPTAALVESPEAADTTDEGLAVVKRLAARSVPSVDFRQVITSFAGVRSSEKGGDFILRKGSQKGILHIAAIDSPGLTSCVSIACMGVDMLREMGLETEDDPTFDPHRADPHAFSHMDEDQQAAYIRENPAFGKIVCRCETVSEGEILQAITQNPPAVDVDGVKRRTRSGMGRCQGGFCGPYVMKLIAEQHKIPLEAVTKKGKGSEMVLGRLEDV